MGDARKAALIEKLACLEHEQWMAWAKTLMETENLSKTRRKRWEQFMVPYEQLPEDVKEYDRVWAMRIIELLEAEGLL